MAFESRAENVVGRRLKAGLAESGRTQADLAAELGVALTTVNRWCNGDMVMSFESAAKICDIFDWPLDRLAARNNQ